MKNETVEILKQANRIKAINQALLRELAALDAETKVCFLSPACHCDDCLKYFGGAF